MWKPILSSNTGMSYLKHLLTEMLYWLMNNQSFSFAEAVLTWVPSQSSHYVTCQRTSSGTTIILYRRNLISLVVVNADTNKMPVSCAKCLKNSWELINCAWICWTFCSVSIFHLVSLFLPQTEPMVHPFLTSFNTYNFVEICSCGHLLVNLWLYFKFSFRQTMWLWKLVELHTSLQV
jgi:hypothetical protein